MVNVHIDPVWTITVNNLQMKAISVSNLPVTTTSVKAHQVGHDADKLLQRLCEAGVEMLLLVNAGACETLR